MNSDEVYLTEFIGNEITVKKSSNLNNVNIKGKLIDETKNMMFIKVNKKILKIPKHKTIFTINFGDNSYDIDGDIIIMRPEDRTKEKRRIYKKLRGNDKNEKYRNRC
jgi:ribonuclease P protein subunit POP4